MSSSVLNPVNWFNGTNPFTLGTFNGSFTNTGNIIALALGCLLFAMLLALLITCCCCHGCYGSKCLYCYGCTGCCPSMTDSVEAAKCQCCGMRYCECHCCPGCCGGTGAGGGMCCPCCGNGGDCCCCCCPPMTTTATEAVTEISPATMVTMQPSVGVGCGDSNQYGWQKDVYAYSTGAAPAAVNFNNRWSNGGDARMALGNYASNMTSGVYPSNQFVVTRY